MSEERFVVEKSRSTGLRLSGLRKASEVDCSGHRRLEVIELHNSPGVRRIHFGDEKPNTSRSIRIGGEWSGSIHIDGSICSLEYISDDFDVVIYTSANRLIYEPMYVAS